MGDSYITTTRTVEIRHWYTVRPGSSDPFLYLYLLYKMGYYFLDIQYFFGNLKLIHILWKSTKIRFALGTIFWKLRFPVPRIQIAGGANSALMRPKLPFYKEANWYNSSATIKHTRKSAKFGQKIHQKCSFLNPWFLLSRLYKAKLSNEYSQLYQRYVFTLWR